MNSSNIWQNRKEAEYQSCKQKHASRTVFGDWNKLIVSSLGYWKTTNLLAIVEGRTGRAALQLNISVLPQLF